jgi:hypothetical protein
VNRKEETSLDFCPNYVQELVTFQMTMTHSALPAMSLIFLRMIFTVFVETYNVINTTLN